MKLFRNSGFSMIDTMIAMGVATIAFVGVSGAMQNAGNPLRKMNADVAALTLRQQAVKLLNRYPSWKQTVLNNDGLNCAWLGQTCGTTTGNGDFDIFYDSGELFFPATDPLFGKKMDGTDCHTFPSADCRIDIRLTWDLMNANATRQGQIKIKVQFWIYDPATGSTTERGDLRFSILKNFYNNNCFFDSTTLAEGESKTAYISSTTDCTNTTQRTCQMGTLDGQDFQYDRCAPAPCANIKKSGFCWYVGALGASCDTTCAAYGGCDATGLVYHGSNGTNSDCEVLMQLMGVAKTFNSVTATALGCYRDTSAANPTQIFNGSDVTTCASSSANVRRACACFN